MNCGTAITGGEKISSHGFTQISGWINWAVSYGTYAKGLSFDTRGSDKACVT